MVYAEYNHGRWIVCCSSCPSAELVKMIGDPAFHCTNCGYDGLVLWPQDPDAIERTVSIRPRAENRNWKPGESVDELAAENI